MKEYEAYSRVSREFIVNPHLHTSQLSIIHISPIKSLFHSPHQKMLSSAFLSLKTNASPATSHTFYGSSVRKCVHAFGQVALPSTQPLCFGRAPALLLVHGYLKFQKPVTLSNTEPCCNEDMREVVLIYSLAYIVSHWGYYMCVQQTDLRPVGNAKCLCMYLFAY